MTRKFGFKHQIKTNKKHELQEVDQLNIATLLNNMYHGD